MNFSRSINITANQLKRNKLNSPEITDAYHECIKIIEDELNKAKSKNVTNVDVEIPATFNIIGADLDVAQTVVYSSIIDELERNGFEVSITFVNANNTILHINWNTKEDDDIYKRMQSVIKRHRNAIVPKSQNTQNTSNQRTLQNSKNTSNQRTLQNGQNTSNQRNTKNTQNTSNITHIRR